MSRTSWNKLVDQGVPGSPSNSDLYLAAMGPWRGGVDDTCLALFWGETAGRLSSFRCPRLRLGCRDGDHILVYVFLLPVFRMSTSRRCILSPILLMAVKANGLPSVVMAIQSLPKVSVQRAMF